MADNRCDLEYLHTYGSGDFCRCGQVPNRLLAAPPCDCGGGRRDPPLHRPDCRAVVWAKERNAWIADHPGINPTLMRAPERRVGNQPEEGGRSSAIK